MKVASVLGPTFKHSSLSFAVPGALLSLKSPDFLAALSTVPELPILLPTLPAALDVELTTTRCSFPSSSVWWWCNHPPRLSFVSQPEMTYTAFVNSHLLILGTVLLRDYYMGRAKQYLSKGNEKQLCEK